MVIGVILQSKVPAEDNQLKNFKNYRSRNCNMILPAANRGHIGIWIGKHLFFVLSQFPYPVVNSASGDLRQRVELKSRLGITTMADGRQHFDRCISQSQLNHNRFAHPRRATDQRRHPPQTEIEAHAASDEWSEAQEALQRDWSAVNIARFTSTDVVRPRRGPHPSRVQIHRAFLS